MEPLSIVDTIETGSSVLIIEVSSGSLYTKVTFGTPEVSLFQSVLIREVPNISPLTYKEGWLPHNIHL